MDKKTGESGKGKSESSIKDTSTTRTTNKQTTGEGGRNSTSGRKADSSETKKEKLDSGIPSKNMERVSKPQKDSEKPLPTPTAIPTKSENLAELEKAEKKRLAKIKRDDAKRERELAKSMKSKQDAIEKMLISVSSLSKSFPNFEHWEMSKNEAKEISTALANVLDSYGFLEKLSGMSDPVALMMAVGMYAMPRALMSYHLISSTPKKSNLETNLLKEGIITNGKKQINSSGSEQDGESNNSGSNELNRDSSNVKNLVGSIIG